MSATPSPTSETASPRGKDAGQFGILPPSPETLAALLDELGLPQDPPPGQRGRGRPRKDRAAIARSLVARALLDLPTTAELVKRLHRDPEMRQACGWSSREDIPSCSTFCRLAPEILGQLSERLRSDLALYYPEHPLRVPPMLFDAPPASEVEPALLQLGQLRDAFVAFARQKQADLSLPQLSVLLACYLAEQPQTIRALRQQLGFNDAALKHTLDRLDRLHLTRATRDKYSRRRYLVHRTRRGTEFLNFVFASVSNARA